MKHTLLRIQLIILFALSVFGVQADNIATHKLQQFVQNIYAFSTLYPQEKVYIHTDNTGYYLGENIWFKAYVTHAPELHPANRSGVLYVELLNSIGNVLETRKLPIRNGQCSGYFPLTDFSYHYYPGYYEIRAYTRMMLNYGDEAIFSRLFPVFDAPKKEGEYIEDMREGRHVKRLNLPHERKKSSKEKRVNLAVLPEGGDLVAGLNSRVAVKATDEYGQPLDVTGEVVSDKGQQFIAEFSTLHDGMGSFYYTPSAEKCHIRIRHNSRTYRFDMPTPQAEGYVMRCNPLGALNILLEIEKNSSQPATPLGLSILSRGSLVHFETISMDENTATLAIPKSGLPAGVNRLTLFSERGEVFAERMVFIHPSATDEMPQLAVIPNKAEYGPRERITIDFQGKPGTMFSLAVRDRANTPQVSQDAGIAVELLLASDLKGYIANPTYYFAATDSKAKAALDLLLLVQGWRRYEWRQMAGIVPFERQHPIEKQLQIDGKVEGKTDRVDLEMTMQDGRFLEGSALVDAQGNFVMQIDTAIYGKYNLLLSAPDLKKADRNIRLNRWFSPTPQPYPALQQLLSVQDEEEPDEEDMQIQAADTVDTGSGSFFISGAVNRLTELAEDSVDRLDSVGMQFEMQEVSVKAKKRGKDFIYHVERDRERLIDMGKSHPEHLFFYLVDKNNGYVSKTDPGLVAEGIPDNTPEISGRSYWGNRVLVSRYVLANGNWITLPRLTPLQSRSFHQLKGGNLVEYIDLENIYRYVIHEWDVKMGYKGTLYIPGYLYSYDNTPYAGYRRNSDFRVTFFEGYSEPRDFYTGRPEREDYLPSANEHARTLYWNPDMQLDSMGRAQTWFYNTTFCRKIAISAEGINLEGMPVSGEIKLANREQQMPNIPKQEDHSSGIFYIPHSVNHLTEITEESVEIPDSVRMQFEMQEISVKAKKRGKDFIYHVERDRERLIDLGKSHPEHLFSYLVDKNNGFLYKSALASEGIPYSTPEPLGSSYWGKRGLQSRYVLDNGNWIFLRQLTPQQSRNFDGYRFVTGGNLAIFVDLEYIYRYVIHEWDVKMGYKGALYIPGYLYSYDNTPYAGYRRNPDFRVTFFEGYSEPRDFYTGRPEREDYLPSASEHARTLYWNPDMELDSTGRAQTQFYNTSFCRNIEISAEGINSEGMPVSGEIKTKRNDSMKHTLLRIQFIIPSCTADL